jgi:hypothetical protein
MASKILQVTVGEEEVKPTLLLVSVLIPRINAYAQRGLMVYF